jgi:hypothetical protein
MCGFNVFVVFVDVVPPQVYLFTQPVESRDGHCPRCLSQAYTHPGLGTSETHGGGNTHTLNHLRQVAHRTGHPQNRI